MSVDLLNLPDVTFAEMDTAKVENSILTMYEGITNTVLYPGDPVRLFLTSLAAIIAQRNVILNDTGQQNLLRYARGAALDNIGAMLGVERLGEKAAQIIVQFTLQEPIGVPMMVPQGTRVTADSSTFFATDDIAVIDPGLVTVTVTATCITMGAAGNGFVVGQVNRLVDPLPFVVNVTNTTASSGGLDVEGDEALRARINLAPESFSTAGSELSYVFWALSARQDISDVSVVSPTPGIVNVYVLLEGGTIPPAGGTEIQDVTDAVSALNRRPLTDMVTVRAPTAVNLDYRLTWYITQSQVTQSAQIEAQIKQAVADYEAWQIEKIGRDINPDRLIELCRAAGAKRIDTSLYFQRLDATQVVQFITNPFRIAFGAVEDE